MKLLLHLLFSLIIFSLGLNVVSFALGSNLTAEVKDTSVVFSGYTSPNSYISFIEDSVVIGTTSSDTSGYFSKTINLITGIHIIRLTANDLSDGNMPSIEFNIILIAHQQTNIINILMPSSLKVSATEYLLNEDIIISGYAKPRSQIELSLIGTETNIYNILSNTYGYFELVLKANTLTPGNYNISSKILVSEIVDNSTIKYIDGFTLINDTNEITRPTPTISPENKCNLRYMRVCYFASFSQESFLTKDEFLRYLNGFIQFNGKKLDNIYDINEDGRIDLSDISIILYYWDDRANLVKGFASEVKPANTAFVFTNSATINNNTNIIINSLLVELIILILSMVFFLILFIYRRKIKEAREN